MPIHKSYSGLHSRFAKFSQEEIEEWYIAVYDRWTWDTGSDDDRKLLELLDQEREYRNQYEYPLKKDDEVWGEIAKNIKDQIDEEILNEILEQYDTQKGHGKT